MKEKNFRTIDLVYMAVCAALMAVCSWISIPTTVPFTLQTFAIFLAVALLGGKNGTLSVLVYILLGAVGAPVFAGFSGGFSTLAGPTGGYIIGFIFSALVMWLVEKLAGRKLVATGIGMALGLLVCYAFGTAWFMVVYAHNGNAITLGTALGWCVIPFIIPDVCKIALALFLSKVLRKAIFRETASVKKADNGQQ